MQAAVVWSVRTCVRDRQGHPHAQFRRALLTKNLRLIDAAARELNAVGLDDALRILVVLADKRDERFERAAVKSAARVVLERRLSPRKVTGCSL
jgi:hypothetical protein